MRNRTSTTFPVIQSTRMHSTRSRVPASGAAGRGFRRIRRSWYSPPPMPSLEEAERRIRSRPGFIASLTPEQIAMITAYDGPEVFGNPNGPKRTFDVA